MRPGARSVIADDGTSAGCLGGLGDEVERGGVGELGAGEHGGLGDVQVVKELLNLSRVRDREHAEVLVPGAGLEVRGWYGAAAVRGQGLAGALVWMVSSSSCVVRLQASEMASR